MSLISNSDLKERTLGNFEILLSPISIFSYSSDDGIEYRKKTSEYYLNKKRIREEKENEKKKIENLKKLMEKQKKFSIFYNIKNSMYINFNSNLFQGKMKEIYIDSKLENAEKIKEFSNLTNYLKILRENNFKKIRAYIVNLISKFCVKFNFKRETFYLSIKIFDNYYQENKNFPSNLLIELATCSLYISSLLNEDIQPLIINYVDLVNNYSFFTTVKKFMDLALIILNHFNYKIKNETLVKIFDEILFDFDYFLKNNCILDENICLSFFQNKLKNSDKSFLNYYNIHKLLDVIIHDEEYKKYDYIEIIYGIIFYFLIKIGEIPIFSNYVQHSILFDAEFFKGFFEEECNKKINYYEEELKLIYYLKDFIIYENYKYKFNFDKIQKIILFIFKFNSLEFNKEIPKIKKKKILSYIDLVSFQTKIDSFGNIMNYIK